MTDPDRLARECARFSHYLVGSRADDYVLSKYREAHEARPELHPHGAFDRWLVRAASSGPLLTTPAAAFSAALARSSSLQKKLVLLLAILETSPVHHRALDRPGRGVALAGLAVAGRTLWAALALLLGLLLFGTARLLQRGDR